MSASTSWVALRLPLVVEGGVELLAMPLLCVSFPGLRMTSVMICMYFEGPGFKTFCNTCPQMVGSPTGSLDPQSRDERGPQAW